MFRRFNWKSRKRNCSVAGQPSKDAFADFGREGALVSGKVIGGNREEVRRVLLKIPHNIGGGLADDKRRAGEVIAIR